jgi:hypothetical protein
MAVHRDLTGKEFGRLTVLRRGLGRQYKTGAKPTWICICTCGNTIDTLEMNLVRGQTNSCGCLHRELASARRTTHGASTTPEYGVWQSMLNRCRNKSTNSYQYYGGRGIKVCARWRRFENFIADMGPRPTGKHSIERKDNDGDYTPSNCHWASTAEQARNRTDSFIIQYGGESKHLTAWRRDGGIPAHVLNRLARGWPLRAAVDTPKGCRRRPQKKSRGRRFMQLD